jgi:hypothetical protein
MWIYINDFSESSDEFWRKNGAEGYISLCWPCYLVGKSLVSGGASVEMKIKFVNLNPDVCIFSSWLCCIRKITN